MNPLFGRHLPAPGNPMITGPPLLIGSPLHPIQSIARLPPESDRITSRVDGAVTRFNRFATTVCSNGDAIHLEGIKGVASDGTSADTKSSNASAEDFTATTRCATATALRFVAGVCSHWLGKYRSPAGWESVADWPHASPEIVRPGPGGSCTGLRARNRASLMAIADMAPCHPGRQLRVRGRWESSSPEVITVFLAKSFKTFGGLLAVFRAGGLTHVS